MFGYVQRTTINASVRKSDLIQVNEMKRSGGRHKIILVARMHGHGHGYKYRYDMRHVQFLKNYNMMLQIGHRYNTGTTWI